MRTLPIQKPQKRRTSISPDDTEKVVSSSVGMMNLATSNPATSNLATLDKEASNRTNLTESSRKSSPALLTENELLDKICPAKKNKKNKINRKKPNKSKKNSTIPAEGSAGLKQDILDGLFPNSSKINENHKNHKNPENHENYRNITNPETKLETTTLSSSRSYANVTKSPKTNSSKRSRILNSSDLSFLDDRELEIAQHLLETAKCRQDLQKRVSRKNRVVVAVKQRNRKKSIVAKQKITPITASA